MNRAAAMAALFLIVLGSAYARGRIDGKHALQSRLDAAQVQADAATAETSRALMIAERTRREQAQQFEDQLNALPDNGAVCVDAGWVR